MTPTLFLDGRVSLYAGHCMEVLPQLPENSVDSVVVDPPYHLTSIVKRFGGDQPPRTEATVGKHAYGRHATGFMGKQWDGGDIAFRVETWRAVLRVLKPGGYILAFASTRGFGRMSVAIEDAGFVNHPLVDYFRETAKGSDFWGMLSRDQQAALARLMMDAETGPMLAWAFGSGFPKATRIKAEGYDGFRYGGQALKPAIEPIYMGQKPFSEDTGTANILRHGTGALNIDGCRVPTEENLDGGAYAKVGGRTESQSLHGGSGMNIPGKTVGEDFEQPEGRWPANVIHDGSDEVLAAFPDAPGQSGTVTGAEPATGDRYILSGLAGNHAPRVPRDDEGSAARFFYSSKADADDRLGSKHPTVKPLDLMQYLVRLVTPPGGTVLDPFAGTGTTGEAAFREGMRAILIEREPEYQADIARRMDLAQNPTKRAAVAKTKNKLQGAEGTPLFGSDAA